MKLEDILAKRSNKTIYRHEDTVVKVFDKNHPKSLILNEALNQSRVEETGLQIPNIKSVGIVDNCWSITMDYIPGQTLHQLMTKHPERNDELLELFVDLQIKMHAETAPLLTKLKDKLARKIQSVEELDATSKYELLMRLESMPKHTKLCHGDFLPSNIIINDQGAYIIDWSHATQGNASGDVATTYLKMTLFYPELADKYIKLFCIKSDTALQYVQKWLPIVAAQQLITAADKEKEILFKWLDVIDFQG
ncbi:MAG TPA: aminoglycoside phosphotransferase family protein [Clostridiales bacterium]|nr:aminoglycoside phosphotransferase family protein [Clostridiales bacterium]